MNRIQPPKLFCVGVRWERYHGDSGLAQSAQAPAWGKAELEVSSVKCYGFHLHTSSYSVRSERLLGEVLIWKRSEA